MLSDQYVSVCFLLFVLSFRSCRNSNCIFWTSDNYLVIDIWCNKNGRTHFTVSWTHLIP